MGFKSAIAVWMGSNEVTRIVTRDWQFHLFEFNSTNRKVGYCELDVKLLPDSDSHNRPGKRAAKAS